MSYPITCHSPALADISQDDPTFGQLVVSNDKSNFMKKYIIIILTLVSCQQDDIKQSESNPDYIIFGHFYGECIGEKCVEMYKLTNNHLYEDTNDRYPNSNERYVGNFELLDDALFEKVKGLNGAIPVALLTTDKKIIGQPDAGDWGGLYFEISTDGKKGFWLIDKKEENLPDDLKPFVKEVENSISLINN